MKLPEALSGQVEGRSLVPLLADPQAAWADRYVVTHVGRWDRGQVAGAKYRNCSIRDSRWQMVSVAKSGERAWQLFRARSRLALERGVVGGLPENLDAHPHPGATEPRLTGTYLQAWSNTEHLRAWYQVFLGVRPMLDHGRIRLAPRLPAAFGDVDFEARIGYRVKR